MHFLFSLFQKKPKNPRGAGLIIFIVVFGTIGISLIVLGVAGYGISEERASVRKHTRDEAFHIAEAGVHYYRWHLAHDPTDYKDGTGVAGPYLHEYYDKDGNISGYFSLTITPPLSGSTIVTVESQGWTKEHPEITRRIQVKLGYPSLTDFTFIENANMAFSATTQVHGKVHSNGNIVFDGTTDSIVEAVGTITGSGGPQYFWTTPATWVDYNAISADISALDTLAQNGGIKLNSSGKQGYQIVFKADGTFDLYKVNTVSCYYALGYNQSGRWVSSQMCYDIATKSFVQNYPIPANGAIFVDDHVWVSGVVNGRVTVGARRLPDVTTKYRNIIVDNNLTYNAISSDDVLGLIAQGDIIVPKSIPTTMTIQAAALSQHGQIYRPMYDPAYYSDVVKNSLTFFGSQISYTGGGWKYISNGTVVSGFVNTNHTYDGNLRYLPPPSFPVGNVYELISWKEVE